MSITLSVIMPAYNEQERICANALETSKALEAFCESYELIVVNDGSTDETYKQAALAAAEDNRIRIVDSPVNQGKGFALKLGTAQAVGERIAFCDADLDLHPHQLAGFMKLMDEQDADAVIGSKMHRDSKVDYPFLRRVYSYCYYLFLLAFFHLNTKDTQTGLKLFRASVIKPVMEKILVKRFACDIEILSIIRKQGGKIVSAPIEVVFRRGSFGRIGIKDVYSILRDTMAVFYRLNILHYYDESPKAD
ncbi:MAG: glycosyltransferase [Oscillospiraceae bacterium]|nr:glycosyltransferase [Oscillospiraceae bacterium]